MWSCDVELRCGATHMPTWNSTIFEHRVAYHRCSKGGAAEGGCGQQPISRLWCASSHQHSDARRACVQRTSREIIVICVALAHGATFNRRLGFWFCSTSCGCTSDGRLITVGGSFRSQQQHPGAKTCLVCACVSGRDVTGSLYSAHVPIRCCASLPPSDRDPRGPTHRDWRGAGVCGPREKVPRILSSYYVAGQGGTFIEYHVSSAAQKHNTRTPHSCGPAHLRHRPPSTLDRRSGAAQPTPTAHPGNLEHRPRANDYSRLTNLARMTFQCSSLKDAAR